MGGGGALYAQSPSPLYETMLYRRYALKPLMDLQAVPTNTVVNYNVRSDQALTIVSKRLAKIALVPHLVK